MMQATQTRQFILLKHQPQFNLKSLHGNGLHFVKAINAIIALSLQKPK